MNNVLIIGSSGHCSVVVDAIEKMGGCRIAGLIDDDKKYGEKSCGYEILGTINDIKKIAKEYAVTKLFIAVGSNWNRHLIYQRIEPLGFEYLTVIHPSACIAKGIHIGDGTLIAANVVINPGSFIGNQCIINTGAIIEHDNVVMDFASVSPGSVIGGNVHIGKFSFIGLGSKIKNKITIGEHSVIGMGSTVIDFISDRKLAYGSPCKEIETRKKEDKYL